MQAVSWNPSLSELVREVKKSVSPVLKMNGLQHSSRISKEEKRAVREQWMESKKGSVANSWF